MDTETVDAIDTLRADIHRGDASLGTETRQLRVVVESLRDDIRIVAEGVVALTAKVDSFAR